MQRKELQRIVTELLDRQKGHPIVNPRLILREGKILLVSKKEMEPADIIMMKLLQVDIDVGLTSYAWDNLLWTADKIIPVEMLGPTGAGC